jgi:hypothetical protein
MALAIAAKPKRIVEKCILELEGQDRRSGSTD